MQITLHVPDENHRFFLELVKQLGYIEITDQKQDQDFVVPEGQKEIIRQRMAGP